VREYWEIPDLEVELCALTYRFQGDKFRLSEKEEIREEIGESPDLADALALTFAWPVAPRTIEDRVLAEIGAMPERSTMTHEYDPHGRAGAGSGIKVEYNPYD